MTIDITLWAAVTKRNTRSTQERWVWMCTWSSSRCVSSSILLMSSIDRSTQRSSQQKSWRWKLVKSLFSCYLVTVWGEKTQTVTGINIAASACTAPRSALPCEWISPPCPAAPTSGSGRSPACRQSWRDSYFHAALSAQDGTERVSIHAWSHLTSQKPQLDTREENILMAKKNVGRSGPTRTWGTMEESVSPYLPAWTQGAPASFLWVEDGWILISLVVLVQEQCTKQVRTRCWSQFRG